VLHPAVDRGVIDVQTPLSHHLFKIAITERVAQVPAHTQQNDFGLEMTPFERALIAHEGNSSAVLEYSRVYQSIIVFATQPNEPISTYGVQNFCTPVLVLPPI
jgi:hypothetical protein